MLQNFSSVAASAPAALPFPYVSGTYVSTDVPSDPVYAFAGFRLTRTLLEFDGQMVPLAPKALETLFILVAEAPGVVTKADLLRRVWPDTFVVESGLARNISVIRTALEERAGSMVFIETLPKRGYRFVAPVTVWAGSEREGNEGDAMPVSVAPMAARKRRLTVLSPVRLGIVMLALVFSVVAVRLWIRSRAAMGSAPVPPQPVVADSLIGEHLFLQATPAEVARAVRHFEMALAAHPDDASLHAALAKGLLTLPRLAAGGPELLVRARASAETALRLDPRSADVQAAWGAVLFVADWNLPAAEAALRRSLELDGQHLLALFYWSELLQAEGRFAESRAVAERAALLDPVSPILGLRVAVAAYFEGRYEEAAVRSAAVLERERHFALAHYYRALSLAFLMRADEAVAHLERAELSPGVLRTDRAWVRAQSGDRREAEIVLADLIRLEDAKKVGPASTLLLAVTLGRWDVAEKGLRAAIQDRDPGVLFAATDPRLRPLQSQPRLMALLREAGIAPAGLVAGTPVDRSMLTGP